METNILDELTKTTERLHLEVKEGFTRQGALLKRAAILFGLGLPVGVLGVLWRPPMLLVGAALIAGGWFYFGRAATVHAEQNRRIGQMEGIVLVLEHFEAASKLIKAEKA